MSNNESAAADSRPVVASVRGLQMQFGPTRALAGVDLDLHEGEVLGLVGTNGAGKSTLIKILSGVHQPTAGHIEIDGERVQLPDPLAATRAGVGTVHQNIDDGVVPGMSAAENLALDSFADGSVGSFVSHRRVVDHARQIAASLGFDVELDTPVERLSASERQQLIIARALARQPRVLILDEPTSTLSTTETELLFRVVERLSSAGVAIIYISHYLGEVERLCDRVAVLRDGELAGNFLQPFGRTELIESMLGDFTVAERTKPRQPGTPVLELHGMRAWPDAPTVDLTVYAGQVLGLTGLIAAGKSELLEQVFGARPLVDGTMVLNGQPYLPSDTRDAVRAGVALVPEERGTKALVPTWSVTRNLTLPYLERYRHVGGLVRRGREHAVAERYREELAIKCGGVDAPIESLSGGNQQKVVVGRWLQGGADLLLLDEPFRGIDVGSRRDIADKLREAARDRAVVVSSSDPEEIIEVADRIVVIAEGSIVGETDVATASTSTLAQLMSGTVTA